MVYTKSGSLVDLSDYLPDFKRTPQPIVVLFIRVFG